jgi:hypothetical protein
VTRRLPKVSYLIKSRHPSAQQIGLSALCLRVRRYCPLNLFWQLKTSTHSKASLGGAVTCFSLGGRTIPTSSLPSNLI